MSDDLRSELIEFLLQRKEKLSMTRRFADGDLIEDWEFGNDWFRLTKMEIKNENNWIVLFGTGLFGKNQLEGTIKWVEAHEDINWI